MRVILDTQNCGGGGAGERPFAPWGRACYYHKQSSDLYSVETHKICLYAAKIDEIFAKYSKKKKNH